MAEVGIEKKVISKKNAGFPEWLDFEKLRKEGIDYLGELSGKIWTDHNVHDPGITILEMLCYALLDLGYRTSLPPKDLFTRDPSDPSTENNFFTPSQILTCNPLTIMDYRRLIVDVPLVKNAWLTVAEDITVEQICDKKRNPDEYYSRYSALQTQQGCISFLNGLYHVYLDLEDDLTQDQKDETITKVKEVLMAHRNLCEDFFDITILCKQKIGVCVDIGLESSADPDTIFLKMIEKLRDFFSPAPKFYRLKQLLEEKGRSIEEAFAGRPFDLTQSHGFVDIEEFEKIVLHKEIHLSDVYNVLYNIEGISAISDLKLKNCDGTVCDDRLVPPWIFKIYENHVPVFSLDCSGFQFTRNGSKIIIDSRKFKEYLKLNFSNSGKTLMKVPSPNLDLQVPVGNYREDLAEYYPIEDDFPKVYGIAEGSLPDNVSIVRKSQALQLKSYLLFFDHLLSGYLTQLKNIRSLFAFDPGTVDQQHTYFINRLTNWPGLEKLLRYSPETNSTGGSGSDVAFPVNKKILEYLIQTGKINQCEMEKDLRPYLFSSAAERDIAINQVIEDLAYGSYTDQLVENKNGCWSFYFFTSSEKLAIVGHGQYQTETDARAALTSIRYLSAEKKSYRPYITRNKTRFSFNIGSSVTGYWDYLQLLVEDKKLYLERKNDFLNHLLARFSETFTDYALLSYSFFQGQDLLKNDIANKQKFLTAYPELSSTRGKGYDYQADGWNNNNTAGVTKKFGAYAGIGTGKQEHLCHYEVAEYEEQTEVNLSWKDQTLFTSEKSFENREEGKEALKSLLTALNDPANYTTALLPLENKYAIKVNASGNVFNHPSRFNTIDEANKAIDQLRNLFSPTPLKDDIQPTQFQHYPVLKKKNEQNSWTKKEPVINREPSFTFTKDILSDFSDKNSWLPEKDDIERDSVLFINNPDNHQEFINIKAFEPDVNRVDVKQHALIYQYTVNDLQKNFFFISDREFDDRTIANENLVRLLFMLTNPSNFHVEEKKPQEYILKVIAGNELLATNTIEYVTPEEANQAINSIRDYINEHIYFLQAKSVPYKWRYDFRLGLPGTKEFTFRSRKEYSSSNEALLEAAHITGEEGAYDISLGKNHELELKDEKHPRRIAAAFKLEVPDKELEEAHIVAKDLLEFKKTIGRVNLEPNAPEIETMVVPDKVSRQGNYGYRLVRKDGYHAWNQLAGDFTLKTEKDKKIKEVFTTYQKSFDYLEICYGGDNIRERIDDRGISWYHFLIKSRIDSHSNDKEVILFESTQGYTSREEAQKAFELEYVSILTAATDPDNYREYISLEEKFIHVNDSCINIHQVVFIPKETMKHFGLNTDNAIKQLVELAKTYPVRTIKKSDDLFSEYFLCGKDPKKPEKVDCDEAARERRYYYYTFSGKNNIAGEWISSRYYDLPQEALSQFHFFLILLRYRGNYYITYNECDCTWRVYLREVLAISKKRFKTMPEAWGKEGVEKFICVSQSMDAFPAYLKKEGCCYSFHVACGNLGLIHPCKYETAQKRDEALRKLFEASGKFYKDIQQQHGTQNWENIATNLERNIFGRYVSTRSPCENAIDTIHMLLYRNLDLNNEITAIHADEAGMILRRDTPIVDIERLRWFAHYFPIVKRKLDLPGEVYRYFLEIKLPEFCNDDLDDLKPCGCDEKGKVMNCCCTAWISECCFETCEEALQYYYKIAACLADIDNYYTVFDCECGPYGIRFHCDCDDEKRDTSPRDPVVSNIRNIEGIESTNTNTRSITHCCNEIIAFNPQCYTSPKMVCEAIERAKKLINAEGLHLVEHILLRPHCVDGDCNCLIEPCSELTSCEFTWPLADDDPCDKDKKYCFTPGEDPYSFIATAVLPAWTERFRKKENRQLVEQMLYREMPAHIMLRILWLSPRNLCEFESKYRPWTRWLAHKPVCVDYNPACELIDFLFEHEFSCFDCDECIPCDADSNPPDPCNFLTQAEYDPNKYVNAINTLYCWPLICPIRTKYNPQSFNLLVRNDPQQLTDVQTIDEPEGVTETVDREDAERKIDQRFHQFREEVKSIADSSGNINAAMALSLLNHPAPDFNSYQDVVENIMANKKSAANLKLLSGEQKNKLISVVTWYYLDRIVLLDKINENKSDLIELFRKLESKQLLPVYRQWKGTELTSIIPQTHINEIKKLFK